MEKETKNQRVVIGLLTGIIIILLGLCIYFMFIKKDNKEISGNQPTNSEKEKEERKEAKQTNNTLGLKGSNGEDISLNYEELEKKLLNMVNNGTKVYLDHCDNCSDIDYDNIDEAQCSKKELSVNVVKNLINKLKNANKVEYMPTSRPCAEYTFSIDNGIVAYEADDKSILLVGVNNNGYAFHFTNENIVDFLSNLK